jgi:hypothetical protein
MSVRQVRTYLGEIERNRFIEIDRNDLHRLAAGIGGTFTYYFLRHPAFEGEVGRARKAPPAEHQPRGKQRTLGLQKTAKVPWQETAKVTVAGNCTRKMSSSKGPFKEGQLGAGFYRPKRNDSIIFRTSGSVGAL